MDIPAPKRVPASGYGHINPRLLVIHVSQGPPSDGSGLANYCKTNSGGLRWHRSIGQHGERYRHLNWDEMGAHDAGINSISCGIEHVGYVGKTEYKDMPQLLWASALEAADFCKHVKKKPSRGFIIGHSEDAKFGGTSTHTDPGGKWPWDLYMEMVEAAYDGRKWDDPVVGGGEDMGYEQFRDGVERVLENKGEPNKDADKDTKFGYRFAKRALETSDVPPAGEGEVPAHTHSGAVTLDGEVTVN